MNASTLPVAGVNGQDVRQRQWVALDIVGAGTEPGEAIFAIKPTDHTVGVLPACNRRPCGA